MSVGGHGSVLTGFIADMRSTVGKEPRETEALAGDPSRVACEFFLPRVTFMCGGHGVDGSSRRNIK